MRKESAKAAVEKPVVSETPVTEAKKPEKSPQKYTLDALRENSIKLFGVSESTFIGASYGLEGEYTISEMKNIIKEWKKKEAK